MCKPLNCMVTTNAESEAEVIAPIGKLIVSKGERSDTTVLLLQHAHVKHKGPKESKYRLIDHTFFCVLLDSCIPAIARTSTTTALQSHTREANDGNAFDT